MLVDRAYLQTVSSVMRPIRARRRMRRMVAVAAFLCGLASAPLSKQLTGQVAEPAAASPSVEKQVEPPLPMQTSAAPLAAAPRSEPPHRAPLSLRDALQRVRDARELMEAGRLRDARDRLTEVLRDRPGYPPALAGMAALALENAQAAAALRWAQLAVRAQPTSVENWDLLGRALTVAGRHAESDAAHAHATELYLRRDRVRD